MNNLQVMIKILKILDENFGNEDFDNDVISAEALGIEKGRCEQLLIEMQRSGLIKGLNIRQPMNGAYEKIVGEPFPLITKDGMEYLNEINLMLLEENGREYMEGRE